jgi:hypothetical protein
VSDGTLLLGPLSDKPKPDFGPFVEGVLDGKPWYVVYCCNELNAAQKEEVKRWAERCIDENALKAKAKKPPEGGCA